MSRESFVLEEFDLVEKINGADSLMSLFNLFSTLSDLTELVEPEEQKELCANP